MADQFIEQWTRVVVVQRETDAACAAVGASMIGANDDPGIVSAAPARGRVAHRR